MQFDSVLLEENKIYCSSQRFILGHILKRSNFFTDETEKLVLTCLRLETDSNIYYFWSFTIHSISSSVLFCGPGALLLRFTLRGHCTPFISVIHPFEFFKKRQFFHRWDQKVGFNLSTLMNRFQHLLLLKFHHALKIFIKILFAALVHFYYVLLRDSKIFCSSQWIIHEGFFKKKHFLYRWDEKMVLTCLHLETGSNIYYFWRFTMHSISSSNFFWRPWCNYAPF